MAYLDNSSDLPRDRPFDYQLAMDRLRDYRAPRDKLGHLCASGAVVRVRKGLYVPGRAGREQAVDPLVLAGLVYGPSYVSLETALAWYGLILERVEEITSMTSKRAKEFRTPVGRFRYEPVPERTYAEGVRLEAAAGGSFFLAEPEKALCDRVALVRGLTAAREVAEVLAADLRVDVEVVCRTFRRDLVAEIARQYRRKNVSAFHRWLTHQEEGGA